MNNQDRTRLVETDRGLQLRVRGKWLGPNLTAAILSFPVAVALTAIIMLWRAVA